MIIGQIDYLNLLPFKLFMKKYGGRRYVIMNKHKGYPTQMNRAFLQGKIHAGFFSSIISPNKRCLNVGIIAFKEVKSVLVIKGNTNRQDIQSASSNALAKILAVQGEVIIGDKALQYYSKCQGDKNYFIDLATLWWQKHKLPFVFARFCINKDYKFYHKLMGKFVKNRINIPQYILHQQVDRLNIPAHLIKAYLQDIHYNMGLKEQLSLKIFFRHLALQ